MCITKKNASRTTTLKKVSSKRMITWTNNQGNEKWFCFTFARSPNKASALWRTSGASSAQHNRRRSKRSLLDTCKTIKEKSLNTHHIPPSFQIYQEPTTQPHKKPAKNPKCLMKAPMKQHTDSIYLLLSAQDCLENHEWEYIRVR